MSDKLEKFIRENRAAFDDQSPDLRIWGNIDRQLNPPRIRRLSIRYKMKYAAAIVVLLGFGFAFGYILHTGNSEEIASAGIQSEYQEMESYYNNQINEKMAVLANYNSPDAVEPDIAQIDETIAELKKELEGIPAGNEEQVIHAIIQNYQTKIAILETILNRLPSNHQIENKNETTEI